MDLVTTYYSIRILTEADNLGLSEIVILPSVSYIERCDSSGHKEMFLEVDTSNAVFDAAG